MTTSPGWYKDPAEPSTQRYWDGEGWVGAALPIDAMPPAGPPPVVEQPTPAPTRTIQAPMPTMPRKPIVPVRPQGLPLATPGARLVARIIDACAVLLLNIAVNGWFVYQWLLDFVPYSQSLMRAMAAGKPVGGIKAPDRVYTLLLVMTLLAMALWFAYEVPATAQSGQTLGKRAMQIKVVRVESQEPVGFMRAWRRWNPLGLPMLLFSFCGPFFAILQVLDVMFIPMDRAQRMALHDRSAGTYVVQLPTPSTQKGK